MEPAKIDWKRIEWKFVEDKLYEHINAPKWVDFTSPQDPVDNDAWFCRPDCRHPKTVEDFLKLTPTKLPSSSHIPEVLPLGDWNQRDAKLNRRGLNQSSILSNGNHKFNEEGENQNPNFSTPPNHQTKSAKTAIKSSTEKKKPLIDDMEQNNEEMQLKSTLPSSNLFAGRDILNQISEFCNELKRMAMRAGERENVEQLSVNNNGVEAAKEEEEKERKPLIEMNKEETDETKKSISATRKQRIKKRFDETENVPLSLDVKNLRRKKEDGVLLIRTNPPSPQCFSAKHVPTKTTTTTPSKASKSSRTEREIFQQAEQNKRAIKEPTSEGKRNICIVGDGREGRTLDVFWFLRPCSTLSLSSS